MVMTMHTQETVKMQPAVPLHLHVRGGMILGSSSSQPLQVIREKLLKTCVQASALL